MNGKSTQSQVIIKGKVTYRIKNGCDVNFKLTLESIAILGKKQLKHTLKIYYGS